MREDSLPEFTHPFFWDVDASTINPVGDYFFVIERLLEYGNDDAIRWLMAFYRDEQLQEVVKKSRNISKKTAYLWQNYFNLPREEIVCLKKSSPKTGNVFWNY
ncbi:MAG: hypothetical protein H0Z39_08365 [Peptococcaceae bacterium]|nr:hypothetical protein [Peptococcaceae bacterium]